MENINDNEGPVKIFWTGGWDSTFRLLKLVLMEKKVQPYYLIDPGRKSLDIEIRVMDAIRGKVKQKFPAACGLILPTIFYHLNDIKDNGEITEKYHHLLEKAPLGIQYDWLARLCCQEKMDGVELCIEKGAGSGITSLLRPLFQENHEGEDHVLDPKYSGTAEYDVLHFFKFPLAFMTKMDMRASAEANDFLDILCKTWFCHKPVFNRFPCGACNPCKMVIKDGLGFRVPLVGRILRFLCDLVYNTKNFLKKAHRVELQK